MKYYNEVSYATFIEIDTYLNNIKHEYIDVNPQRNYLLKMYIFQVIWNKVKPGAEVAFRLCYQRVWNRKFMNKSFEQLTVSNEDNIKMEYVELKKLTKAIKAFDLMKWFHQFHQN